MQHVIIYDLARGLHIIAAITWISGLVMLPRFYALISATAPGDDGEKMLLASARSIRTIILSPGLVLSWAFGIFLFATYFVSDWQAPLSDLMATVPLWFWFKLILVIGLSTYHGFLVIEGRRLANGQRPHSERFWRMMAIAPFITAAAAVLLATLEP